jgi:uncharacterized membrane protein YdbT with pleckstrin-like domain
MFNESKALVLQLLKVPPEPQPPAGAPGSLRVFRAAPNYYRLRLLLWVGSQVSALVGLLIAIVALHGVFGEALLDRQPQLRPLATVILGLESLGVITFFLQIPITYAATRLNYELRWYLVTDRSLRIRTGVWSVEELTMTFANIQEITVHQGPLQRLLKIADLKVRSAGGGGSQRQEGHTIRETHVAYFHGVENAAEIRDVILEHLRRQRDTGLGDPDAESGVVPPAQSDADPILFAAREILIEARALRASLTSGADSAPRGERPGEFQ